jgi:hypothetical protein
MDTFGCFIPNSANRQREQMTLVRTLKKNLLANTCILIDSMTQGATHCFGQVYPELKWMRIFSLGIPFDTKPCAVNSYGIGCALNIVDDICLDSLTDQWKQTKMDDPHQKKKKRNGHKKHNCTNSLYKQSCHHYLLSL